MSLEEPTTEPSQPEPEAPLGMAGEAANSWRHAKADFRRGWHRFRWDTRIVASVALVLAGVSLVQANWALTRVGEVENYLNNPSLYQQPADLDAFISKVRQSVVVIECNDSFGSGWVVDLGSPPRDADPRDIAIDKQYPTEVVTNHHVIEECTDTPGKVRATAFDETYDAWLYSWDKQNDLALVAIRQQVPALEIAREPLTGYWTMAIGAPYGLEGSVSIGNIINTTADFEVVSSAPLNSGNSGGPLVNSRGRVVGTNTWAAYGESNPQDWNVAMAIPALCAEIVDGESDSRWTWGWTP